jgi:hypothetical protein
MTLLAALPAVAGTNTLTGKFERVVGASSSKITIKVETNKRGVATKVKSFSVKGTSECRDAAEGSLEAGPVINAKLGSFKITSSAGGSRFEGTKRIKGVKHTVSGSFTSKKGRKVSGSIRAKGRIADKACVFPANQFSAERK